MLKNIGTVATQSVTALGQPIDARSRLDARPGELLGVRSPVRHVGGPLAADRSRKAARSAACTTSAACFPKAGRADRCADPGRTGAAQADSKGVVAVAELNRWSGRTTRRFLNDWVLHLWPDAVHRYPNIFKWDYLFDPAGGVASQRLDAQLFVANVDPSERYTQSLPGTTEHRIRS